MPEVSWGKPFMDVVLKIFQTIIEPIGRRHKDGQHSECEGRNPESSIPAAWGLLKEEQNPKEAANSLLICGPPESAENIHAAQIAYLWSA